MAAPLKFRVEALAPRSPAVLRGLTPAEARVVQHWLNEVDKGARNLCGCLPERNAVSGAHNAAVKDLAELGVVKLRGTNGWFVEAIDVEACRLLIRTALMSMKHKSPLAHTETPV